MEATDHTVGEPVTAARDTPGPRVLVAVASKHGSTRGIAEALARDLEVSPAGRSVGLTAYAISVDQHPDPSAFDAVVLGSAVYVGRWIESARQFASTHVSPLRSRPLWLFSSGPIGQPPFPPDEPHDARPIGDMLSARGHRVFPGRLDKELLSVGERAMVTAMRAPLGDFRDWALVRGWAEQIAAALADEKASLARPHGTR